MRCKFGVLARVTIEVNVVFVGLLKVLFFPCTSFYTTFFKLLSCYRPTPTTGSAVSLFSDGIMKPEKKKYYSSTAVHADCTAPFYVGIHFNNVDERTSSARDDGITPNKQSRCVAYIN